MTLWDEIEDQDNSIEYRFNHLLDYIKRLDEQFDERLCVLEEYLQLFTQPITSVQDEHKTNSHEIHDNDNYTCGLSSPL